MAGDIDPRFMGGHSVPTISTEGLNLARLQEEMSRKRAELEGKMAELQTEQVKFALENSLTKAQQIRMECLRLAQQVVVERLKVEGIGYPAPSITKLANHFAQFINKGEPQPDGDPVEDD